MLQHVVASRKKYHLIRTHLDSRVGPLATDHALRVEYGVGWVGGELVLGSVTDQTLSVLSEGHVRGSDSVALVVGNDFYTAVLEHTHTEKIESLGGGRDEL